MELSKGIAWAAGTVRRKEQITRLIRGRGHHNPRSIMRYSFPPELLQSGVGTASNTKLSTGDKRCIRRMYPKG